MSLGLAGPVALRLGWRHHRAPVALGWAALALAAVLLARDSGAWGLAVGSTVAMLSALALLAQAALATPSPRRATAGRIAMPLPAESIDWPDVRRRAGVFLVVIVLDLVATLFLAWSAQRALFRSGANAADATALALLLLPVLWLGLASWQMTRNHLGTMLPLPVALIVVGGVTWLAA